MCPFPQPLATTNLPSVSMDLPILSILYICYYAICVLLCLASFIWYNVFKVHSCCSMYQNFTPFYGWIIFIFVVWIYHILFIHSSLKDSWVVSIFQRNYEKCCCKHSCISFCVQTCFHFFLGIYLNVELLSHIVTWCLTFWGTSRLFFKVTVQFNIPTNLV